MHYHNVSTDYSCTESEIGIVASSQKYLPSLSTRSARAAYESLLMTRWDAGMKSSIYDWKDTFYLVCTVSITKYEPDERNNFFVIMPTEFFLPPFKRLSPHFRQRRCRMSRVPSPDREERACQLFVWLASRQTRKPARAMSANKKKRKRAHHAEGWRRANRTQRGFLVFLSAHFSHNSLLWQVSKSNHWLDIHHGRSRKVNET